MWEIKKNTFFLNVSIREPVNLHLPNELRWEAPGLVGEGVNKKIDLLADMLSSEPPPPSPFSGKKVQLRVKIKASG